MSTEINENTLQDLAYRIWEAEGRPFGEAERHWQMALEQVQMGANGSATADSPFGGDLETTPARLTAESANTAEQPLVGSLPTEKIGGKRKTKAKAKAADTLADQDTGSTGLSKSKKRKGSNNIVV